MHKVDVMHKLVHFVKECVLHGVDDFADFISGCGHCTGGSP